METNFDHLEEKVLNAIRLIKELRAENSQLQQQRDELESLCETLKEDQQRMSRELEENRANATTLGRFEEKRRIIEEKVGGLLEKLEQVG
jgi:hypothetical protein